MKSTAIILIMLFVSSCGFKPMLAKNAPEYRALTEVRVISIDGPNKLRLEHIINEEFESDISGIEKYNLKISVSYNTASMGIMKDSQITRYRITAILDYTLLDAETQKKLDIGNISLNGSYDSANSDYANYVANRHVSDNLIKELASYLQRRLSLVIADLGDRSENSN